MDSNGSVTLALNATHVTTELFIKPPGLHITYNVLLVVTTIIAMFSMGSAMTFNDLKMIVKKPVGPVIGMVSQFFLLPACYFGVAKALSLAPNLALGMVLTGSCPGGCTSNIIAFWTKADICLSVCMTAVSTTLAIGFLPLNMFIYSRFWVDDMTRVPYVEMVVTVIYVWTSVICGYFIGRRWPQFVPFLTQYGSLIAVILILVMGLIQAKLYPELFDLGWQTWFAAILMPIIGFGVGFTLALIFCQRHEQRLAIGIETSVQNTALALTVTAISFSTSWESSYYSQFTLLYTTFQIVLSIMIVVGTWIYWRVRYNRRVFCKNEEHMDELSSREVECDPGKQATDIHGEEKIMPCNEEPEMPATRF